MLSLWLRRHGQGGCKHDPVPRYFLCVTAVIGPAEHGSADIAIQVKEFAGVGAREMITRLKALDGFASETKINGAAGGEVRDIKFEKVPFIPDASGQVVYEVEVEFLVTGQGRFIDHSQCAAILGPDTKEIVDLVNDFIGTRRLE